MKIITVTLNPCIDVNYKTDISFEAGKLNRVPAPEVSYNGKGINVSRELKYLSEESICLTFCDGGGELFASLRKEGLNVMGPTLDSSLRRNTAIIDKDGVQTQINEPGMFVSEEKVREFTGMYKAELNSPDERCVIISGSIPPGISPEYVRKLVSIAKGAGAFCIVDCDGEALRCAVEATPDIISPNEDEFFALSGKRLSGSGEDKRIDAVRAALEYYRNEECGVLLTLGEDGSVYAGREGSFMCQSVKCDVKNFKGAGDCFLAAFVYEHIVGGRDCDISMMLAASAASKHMSK